ncbi:MAG: hypothetical protein ABS76_26385 [Pelagibacterium sp. SCN 64-44]|nr:MAG: hypothetical protein ABS76_26385 [Pelagibacterium sp. SCN 64-44]
MIRLFTLILLAFLFSMPAMAARLISQVSTDTVEITSSFAGEKLTFFGTIVPDTGSDEEVVEGTFHVVVVVLGPTQNRVARQMSNVLGVWLNTDQVEFEKFPSYFHVLSSAKLSDISDITTLTTNFITPESHTLAALGSDIGKNIRFGRELIRLMTKEGLFGVQENAVNFMSDNFYSARLTLPSNAPPGPYIAMTYVFQNGELIARKSEGFGVRKIGFERFLALSSVQQPLLYGLVCVVLALFTGWLGGVLFRR